jgi:hypothetical protein
MSCMDEVVHEGRPERLSTGSTGRACKTQAEKADKIQPGLEAGLAVHEEKHGRLLGRMPKLL